MAVRRYRKKSRRRVKKNKKKVQHGGAHVRYKGPSLRDKIAYGASMFLAGPNPGWMAAGKMLGSQALKGITDNVKHYRSRRR